LSDEISAGARRNVITLGEVVKVGPFIRIGLRWLLSQRKSFSRTSNLRFSEENVVILFNTSVLRNLILKSVFYGYGVQHVPVIAVGGCRPRHRQRNTWHGITLVNPVHQAGNPATLRTYKHISRSLTTDSRLLPCYLIIIDHATVLLPR